MTPEAWTRRVITLCVIPCGLLWIVLGTLVLPLHEHKRRAAAEHLAVVSEIAERSRGMQSEAELAERFGALLDRADAIGAIWAETGSQRDVYDRLTGLARDVGVQVQSVEPGRSHGRPVAASNGTPVETVIYQTELVGDYAEVVEFIGLVETRCGLTTIESFDLRPDLRRAPRGDREGGALVRCLLVTRHTIRAPDIQDLRERTAAAGLRVGEGSE